MVISWSDSQWLGSCSGFDPGQTPGATSAGKPGRHHLNNAVHTLVDTQPSRIERHVGRAGDVVGRAHAGKVEELAGVGPGIAAGLFPRAARFEWRGEVDLDKPLA